MTVTANNPTTGQPGWYEFPGLPAGSYMVQFVAPFDATFTTPFQGGDDSLDSDADMTTGTTGSVMLAAGEMNPTLDAGLLVNAPTAVNLAGFSAEVGQPPVAGLALLALALALLALAVTARGRQAS